ncbi:MAG: hypothetical protein CMF49_05895 [Legionellales bacterium]|nr:hypothetical protein [Legionellales bacterium]|tara:strand:+ start:462 stop:701 length:240 start_codon:yes stop_codon:yes gene_type:complete
MPKLPSYALLVGFYIISALRRSQVRDNGLFFILYVFFFCPHGKNIVKTTHVKAIWVQHPSLALAECVIEQSDIHYLYKL